MDGIEIAKNFRYLSLSQIFVDLEWNTRSKSNVFSDVSDGVVDTTLSGAHIGEGGGILELAQSLEDNGQDTAVVVRPVTNRRSLGGYATDMPFELVCGFRRISAANIVYARGGRIRALPERSIRAEIRELSPEDAVLLNVRENVERAGLQTQDLVWFVTRLQKTGISQGRIAKAIKISTAHVSKLARIAQLPESVLQHWRDGSGLARRGISRRLTTEEMLQLFESTRGKSALEVAAQYELLLDPEKAARNHPDFVGKRIEKTGQMLAELVRAGVFREGSLEWYRVVGPRQDGYAIDIGRADPKLRESYWSRIRAAYEKAKNE